VSSAAFSEKELQQLRNSVYKGYQYVPRNYGAEARAYEDYMSDDNSDSPPEFRNEIDFARYGGGYSSAPSGKPGHDGEVNTSQLWNRVREDIGIKNVDSENDLRQMFDYVMGARAMGQPSDNDSDKPEETTPTNTEPEITQPSDTLTDLRDQYDNNQYGGKPSDMPRMATDGNPYTDAIEYGNDMNDYFQTNFVPSLRTEAKLGSQEIGETGKFYLNKFIGKVPKLGDPKELFDYYSDKINDE